MAPEVQKEEIQQVQNGAVEQAPAEDSQVSDNDGGERPVRNKLKETTITSVPKSTESAAQGGDSSRASSRGRKRSFDDDEDENNDEEAGHRRKRSRDSNTEEQEATKEEAPKQATGITLKLDEDEQAQQEITGVTLKVLEDQRGQQGQPQESASSLKKKRSRDQLDKDESKAEGKEKADVKDTAESGVSTEKAVVEGEPEKKRHRDVSQERKPAPLPNAFANTSTVSPFGSIPESTNKPAEETKPAASTSTSTSAFASSSLAAFASSEQSPFGSLGTSTSSVFKSPTESTPSETEKPAATGFAAAAKPSAFASLGSGSGFSGFGGGFGAAAPSSGGGLTSFAAPGGSALLDSTSAKPFGAEADSDDEEKEKEKEDEEDSGPAQFAEDKTDERFFERQIETGEEEEKTYFGCKAKLFHFTNSEWRERGLGNFKVNVKITNGVEDKNSARMIMRADGVLRVMLNTPLFVGMKVGDSNGKEPNGTKLVHLASLENGRSVPLLLRTGSEEQAKELYNVIQELLKHQ